MINILLKGVFDQGIRDWLCIRYDHHLKSNPETAAYRLVVNEADATFGRWRVSAGRRYPDSII